VRPEREGEREEAWEERETRCWPLDFIGITIFIEFEFWNKRDMGGGADYLGCCEVGEEGVEFEDEEEGGGNGAVG
jgi:hypothetical protein